MNQDYGTMTEEVTISSNKEVYYNNTNSQDFPVEGIETYGTNHLTRIRVSGGLTKNIGNYESLRCDVSIEMPCKTAEEDIISTFNYSKDWVDKRIKELVYDATQNTQ